MTKSKAQGSFPPKAPKKPTTMSHHGDQVTDDYFWLKDLKDPDTLKYIKAENKYSETILSPLRALKNNLFKELKSRMNENDTSAPVPIDGWMYYSQVKKRQQYRAYFRKPRKGGKAQLLLDCNRLARGHKYFSLGMFEVSPNHQWLAYGIDTNGNEKYTIHFKNLISGKVLKEKITDADAGVVWANDNKTIYYSELDQNHRPYRALRHQLGSKKASEIVFEESDLKHFVSVDKTFDSEWILIESSGMVTSEIWFGSAENPNTQFKCISPRKDGHEYSVNSRQGLFYIRSNDKAPNFKLMVTPISDCSPRNWVEFIGEEPEALLRGLIVFESHLVLYKFRNALPEVIFYDFEKEKYSKVRFKEKAFSLGFSGNEEFKTKVVRMVIETPILPPTTFDYDLRMQRRKIIKTEKVKNFKTSNYKSDRLMVPSHDGKQIPVTIFYKKGFKKNGRQPVLLYGYGSYGAIIQPTFMRKSLPLLNRGFAYAIAHIRGGQDLGRSWYEDGKFLNKKNTFKDFISVADWLIEKKWTQSDKLAIMGGSAGGMLMGAVINMRPDLFKVCVAHVPFVDVINTMFDDSLPLTKMEYKEWGDPNDKKFYDYMKSYSPYDNVQNHRYPHMLVTGGLHDFRVTFWEPTKWVAKLREKKSGDDALLLKIKTAAGHFGASGRFDALLEEAEALAFVIKYVGSP